MAVAVPSAHVAFKRKYSKYVRNAFFLAVAIHFVIIYFSPPFTIKPYRLREQKAVEVVELPENIEIPPPPKEVALPQVPVQAASDEEATDEEEIAPTTFDNLDELPPPPPPKTGDQSVFLAFDEPPMMIHYEVPTYPDLAREAGIEGTVMVKVLVDEEGKVISAEVLSSDVTPAMNMAALSAAKRCRFKPAKQRTIPVKAYVVIPFQFQLH
jgi:protein TonB